MSTLKEYLAEKKAQRPLRCVELDHRPVSVVTFCQWRGKEWTLPWSRIDALEFSNEEESERVELFFPNHHVVIIGERFRFVIDELRNFQVSCLRNLPDSHRATLGPAETFIAQLDVNVLAHTKPHPSSDRLS
ncbi:MAG TPA: hypothetical protein VGM64_03330 [Lacunisphaera sp.]|jgi:hypothetical protein